MAISAQKLNIIESEISEFWDESILPALIKYVSIPNKSVAFDPDWKTNGFMDDAMQGIIEWVKTQSVSGMTLECLESPGRTPLLFIEIDGHHDDTVLIYGHMDKQPEMLPWADGLGPWSPVLQDDKLYGRGGADDGYAIFAAIAAIKALKKHGLPHARIVIVLEACEESGSADLPFYLEKLAPKIGTPSFVIGLDSGADNYTQLWNTTSLRGLLSGTLSIDVLSEGVHSGLGSGVVPNPLMIFRQLLSRIEDANTGDILLPELYVDIPQSRQTQMHDAASGAAESLASMYPFLLGVNPVSDQSETLMKNYTWRPQLSVIGIDGVPSIGGAGNVTLPSMQAKLSFRLPPTLSPDVAADAIMKALTHNPPFGAHVRFEVIDAAAGWHAPTLAPWLLAAQHESSQQVFGEEAGFKGEGGSIPFMHMLGETFPQAQFLITGVLGPHSNAHGPNEFLHIPFVKKLTTCLVPILQAHYHAFS